jgi:hypothetical protein
VVIDGSSDFEGRMNICADVAPVKSAAMLLAALLSKLHSIIHIQPCIMRHIRVNVTRMANDKSYSANNI